jgi:hypothetical protein
MSEADRVARERVHASAVAERQRKRQATREEALRQHECATAVDAIIPRVIGLLGANNFCVPGKPPPGIQDVREISWTELRFPPLGDLLGYRTMTGAAWEIARTAPMISGGEGLPHSYPILLVSNGQISVPGPSASYKPKPAGLWGVSVLDRAQRGLEDLERYLTSTAVRCR